MIKILSTAALLSVLLCPYFYCRAESLEVPERVELCAQVQKIEQWRDEAYPTSLTPWRVTSRIQSILTGDANNLLKVGSVVHSRIHSPSITFAASLDEVEGKLVRMVFFKESDTWILEKGTVDSACIKNG